MRSIGPRVQAGLDRGGDDGESEIIPNDETVEGKSQSPSEYDQPSSSSEEDIRETSPASVKKRKHGDVDPSTTGDSKDRKKHKSSIKEIDSVPFKGGKSKRQRTVLRHTPPDLPVSTGPQRQIKGIKDISTTPAKSNARGVKALFYRAMSTQAPLEYEFNAWEQTVSSAHSMVITLMDLSDRQKLSILS
jgi:hypothetical protein